MAKRVRRDKSLKAVRANIVYEGDFFIFEVDHKHIVYNVEQGKTIGRQFDYDGFLDVLLGCWGENEFSFAGCVEANIGDIANPQAVYEIIFVNCFLSKYLLAYSTAFQSKTFSPLDSFQKRVVFFEVDFDLASFKPIFSLRNIEMKHVGKLAVSIEKAN